MKNFIVVIQIISSILLLLAILSQNRGSGLSMTFGGSGGGFYRSKRGIEKILSYLTIALAVIFLVSSFLSSLLNK